VERWLFLDIVIRESSPIFELLSGEDQSLLVRGDALLILDFSLHVIDGVRCFHIQRDCFTRQGLYEDLHSSSKAEHQVECGFFLDVVIRQSSSILQLLSGKDQSLLVWGNALLILDFRLHVIDSVRGLDIQGDCLARQRLHEDLHSSSKAEHQVERGLLLDVVIRQSSPILELFSGEDQSLLVRGNALFVLDFRLNVIDSVRSLHI